MADPEMLPATVYAAQALALLGPYLEHVGEGAASKVGELAVDGAAALWTRVRTRLAGRAPETLRRLEDHPSDSRYRAAAEVELEEAFKADPRWMAEIVALVEAAGANRGVSQQVTQTGTGHVNVQVAGDHNQVHTHGGPRTP